MKFLRTELLLLLAIPVVVVLFVLLTELLTALAAGGALLLAVLVVLLLLFTVFWELAHFLERREQRLPRPPELPVPPAAEGLSPLRYVLAVAGILLAVGLFGLLILLLPIGIFKFGLLVLVFGIYGWMLTAFVHYRHARQVEFQHLLLTAVEARAPLAPAVRAYLRDRPHGPAREVWVAFLMFFVLPGYYWLVHRRNRYDRKAARVADRLDHGFSLHDALQAVPGIVPRETLLAVKIGESTGQLARCLRVSSQGRLGMVLVEMLPGLVYPVFVLVFVSAIMSFWAVFLLPKMERIYKDFGMKLPPVTEGVAALCRTVADYWWLIVLAFVGLFHLGYIVQASSRFRWHFPGLGRFYRMNVQSRVLRMLGVLLDAGKTVPDALGVLAVSPEVPRTARRRLSAARADVEEGQPLAVSLEKEGLLQPAMVPLLHAAERVRNVPWALVELGETILGRLVRLLRRVSAVAFPLNVLVLGTLVGFLALGMFVPLIKLIVGLSQ